MLDGREREDMVCRSFGGRIGQACQGEEVQHGRDGKHRSFEVAALWRESLKTDSMGEGA